MINKINIIYLFLILFITTQINAVPNSNNDLIVKKIAQVIIEEYDKYQNYTFLEKLVLKMGKSTYVDNINIWQKNYNNIDNIKIELHPKLEDMVKIADKNMETKDAEHFRNLLEQLTFLGFKNLQIFYLSVKEYLKKNNLTHIDINIQLIDDSLCNINFFNTKKELYAKEDIIKSEIQKMMKEDNVKYKFTFYSFAFKFLNKIRNKIIQKDMEKMLIKINEKKNDL